jgi:hypothetical protein
LEGKRIPKKILNGKCHNRRPVGKPRTRWEDVLKDTSQILEYEDGGDEQKTEKNRSSSEDGQGPEGAIAP